MQYENLILIRGGNYLDVKKALEDWLSNYQDSFQHQFIFELFKLDDRLFAIQVDRRLDNDRFYYLVNFLQYPFDITYTVQVEGFTIEKDVSELEGEELLIYISEDDTDYDCVYVTTSQNEHYKIDFGGRVTETEETKSYYHPENLNLQNPEIFKTEKVTSDHINGKPVDEISKLPKRLIICSALSALLLGLNHFIMSSGRDFFAVVFFITAGIAGWLFFDYKLLQRPRLYLGGLILSFAVLLYGAYLSNNFTFTESKIALLGSFFPMVLLLTQLPARWIFKRIMKREPIVDKPAPSLADFIYMATLGIPLFLLLIFFAR
jgi:hypothetical protein